MRLRASLVAPLLLTLAASTAASAGEPAPPLPPVPKDMFAGIKCSTVRPDMPASVENNPAFTRATVVAGIAVLPPGKIGPVTIVSSSGYPELDAAVIAAFRGFTCSFDQPMTQSTQLRQSFRFSNLPPEPPADASRCAIVYDRRLAEEQSRPQPIRVVEIPPGKYLCWRWKDFPMVSRRLDGDDDLIILEKDGNGDPVVAAVPGPELRTTGPQRREKISFHPDQSGMPMLAVWMSATTPDAGLFSYVAGERDITLRNLLERWVAVEGRQLIWRMPSQGRILDRDRLNAVAELGAAMWLELAVEGVNDAIAQDGIVGQLRAPMQVCRRSQSVTIQPAGAAGCPKRS